MIYFISCLMQWDDYYKLFPKHFPMYQMQIFCSYIIEGFSSNKIKYKCISIPPINNENCKRLVCCLNDNKYFEYVPIVNIFIFKHLCITVYMVLKILFIILKNKDCTFICDTFNIIPSMLTVILCKIFNKRVITIVTDSPSEIFNNKIICKMCKYIVDTSSKSVYLSKYMSDLFSQKNYVVIDGFAADFKKLKKTYTNNNNLIFMYTGTIDYSNGIDKFILAFKLLKENVELHLYGRIDINFPLHELIKDSKKIKYKGIIDNCKLKSKILRAHFLINPRNPHIKMSKYSFPSKNMFYMSSGIPIICSPIPSMINEYTEYVNFIDVTNINSIYEGLLYYIKYDYNELILKAKMCKMYVLKNKNYKIQINKILNSL